MGCKLTGPTPRGGLNPHTAASEFGSDSVRTVRITSDFVVIVVAGLALAIAARALRLPLLLRYVGLVGRSRCRAATEEVGNISGAPLSWVILLMRPSSTKKGRLYSSVVANR